MGSLMCDKSLCVCVNSMLCVKWSMPKITLLLSKQVCASLYEGNGGIEREPILLYLLESRNVSEAAFVNFSISLWQGETYPYIMFSLIEGLWFPKAPHFQIIVCFLTVRVTSGKLLWRSVPEAIKTCTYTLMMYVMHNLGDCLNKHLI